MIFAIGIFRWLTVPILTEQESSYYSDMAADSSDILYPAARYWICCGKRLMCSKKVMHNESAEEYNKNISSAANSIILSAEY